MKGYRTKMIIIIIAVIINIFLITSLIISIKKEINNLRENTESSKIVEYDKQSQESENELNNINNNLNNKLSIIEIIKIILLLIGISLSVLGSYILILK